MKTSVGTHCVLIAGVLGFLAISNSAVAAPAKGISYFQIYAIRSAQSPNWEYPGDAAVVTQNDHGGAWIDIKVKQLGYSTANLAVMDTYSMTLTGTEYTKDFSGAIVGYVYTFRIQKGFSSGTVSTKANSIISGSWWSDSIRIR